MNKQEQHLLAEKKAVRIITFCGLYLLPFVFLLGIFFSVVPHADDLTSPPVRRWLKFEVIQIISEETLRQHFAAVIGLPMAAIMALWVVTILRSRSGSIEFDVLGFHFRGASGPIVMWVLCFLTIALAIKLLW